MQLDQGERVGAFSGSLGETGEGGKATGQRKQGTGIGKSLASLNSVSVTVNWIRGRAPPHWLKSVGPDCDWASVRGDFKRNRSSRTNKCGETAMQSQNVLKVALVISAIYYHNPSQQ